MGRCCLEGCSLWRTARPWIYVWSSDVMADSTIEPTIVHAIVDDQGNVQEVVGPESSLVLGALGDWP